MKTLTAKDAKYRFGCLIDLARAEPVVIAKHGRPVVVVLAVEQFEQLKAKPHQPPPMSDVTRRQGTDHAGRTTEKELRYGCPSAGHHRRQCRLRIGRRASSDPEEHMEREDTADPAS